MKKYLSILCLLACALTACNRNFELKNPLGVTSRRVDLKKDAGSTHVLVYSDSRWSANFTREVDWASIDRNEGEGNNEFVFTYSENYGVAREIGVVLKTSEKCDTISFVQEGAIDTPSYAFDASSVGLNGSTALLSIPVQTNVTYGLEVLETSVEYEDVEGWISDLKATKDSIFFKVSKNTGDKRKAVINFVIPDVTGKKSDYRNNFTIEQTSEAPELKFRQNADPYVRNAADYVVAPEKNNIVPFLNQVVLTVFGNTEGSEWIKNVSLVPAGLKFSLAANEGENQRSGAIRMQYTDLDGNSIDETYAIVQDAINAFEVIRLLPAGKIPAGLELKGFIVSDYQSENVCLTTQTKRYFYDFDEPHRTAYIESADGNYGFCLKFNTMEDAKIARFSKVTINVGGRNLEIQESPRCYTITGLTAADVIKVEAGSEELVPMKSRSIGELTDLDIFTYVNLKGVEILSKDGSYTNVYEGYSYIDESKGITPPDGVKDAPHWACAPLMMTDREGKTIFMLTNTCAKWRRQNDPSATSTYKYGTCVPQGSGTFKGIVVAEKLNRYDNDNLGAFQIRAMAEEDIQFTEPAFSKSIAEWTWNDQKCHQTPDTGKGEIIIYGSTEIDKYHGLNNPSWYNGGCTDNSAVYIYNRWWDYTKNEGGYFDVSFSTKDASGSNLVFGITWGHGFFNGTNLGAPAHWNMLYSIDGGKTFKKIEGNFLKNSLLFWYKNNTNDSCPGYEEYLRKLPAECFGKDKVVVRLQVADNVSDSVPAVMSDTEWWNNKGRETGKVKNGGYSIRVESISVRYN